MYSEQIEKLEKTITDGFDKLEKMLERMMRVRDCMDGDKLLDNQDICFLLNISIRTLARYRKKGKIRYYYVDKRVYYKASDVKELLKQRK